MKKRIYSSELIHQDHLIVRRKSCYCPTTPASEVDIDRFGVPGVVRIFLCRIAQSIPIKSAHSVACVRHAVAVSVAVTVHEARLKTDTIGSTDPFARARSGIAVGITSTRQTNFFSGRGTRASVRIQIEPPVDASQVVDTSAYDFKPKLAAFGA